MIPGKNLVAKGVDIALHNKQVQSVLKNAAAVIIAGHLGSQDPGGAVVESAEILTQTLKGEEPLPDASEGIRKTVKDVGQMVHATVLKDKTTHTLSQKTVETIAVGLSSGFKYILSAPLNVLFNVGYNIPLAVYKGLCLKPITRESMHVTKDIIFYVGQQNGELSIRTGEAFFAIVKVVLLKTGITIIIVIITFIVVRKAGQAIIDMIHHKKDKSGVDHYKPDNEEETY